LGKNRVKGKFITFEGGEGTGKSTQTHLLADHLRQKNIPVIVTREPGGSDGAELIRALLVSGETTRWSAMSEVLLLYAARVDHWEKVIYPAIEAGKWVICDRFVDSTLAYQGFGRGIDLKFLQQLQHHTLGNVWPDWTIIFDLDPEIGIKRSLNRHTSENRFEHMDLSFHARVRQGFLTIAQQHPLRCHVIQAEDTVAHIHQQIIEMIHPHFFEKVIGG
jgi:dTMP kinase